MFSIDDKELKRYEQDLKTFAKRAFPFATKNTLNKTAFTAQKAIKADLKRVLTLRNAFTVKSIQVEQTRTLDVSRQAAIVGSTADYMEKQEFGGIKTKKGKDGVPIATAYAAGQGENTQPRTRFPRKANTLQAIRIRKGRRSATSSNQSLLFKVQDAVTSGRRYFFHEFASTKKRGVFKVVGGSKKFKRGWPKGAKIKMIWDLTRQSVTTPPKPWLQPVIREVTQLMPLIHRDSLIFQLKKQGLFKG